MPNTKHVDVVMYVEGKGFRVAHFDVDAERVTSAGVIANLLHETAWGFEELAVDEKAVEAGVEDLGDNRETPKPRKVVTPVQGLFYWEIAPGEFSNGVALQKAMENYHAGQVFTEDQIRKFYPGSLWETY